MANRYKNIKSYYNEDGIVFKTNPLYPDIPESEDDIYFIATAGDRYDTIAKRFYGNVEFWWIVASANNSTKDNLVIKPGDQIRVPANKDIVLKLFEQLNS